MDPVLFLPGMHKSAIGSPQKGVVWGLTGGPGVLDVVPFNVGWYHWYSENPPITAAPWAATVGAEFIPFIACLPGSANPNDPTSYPSHLSKDYSGYMLFLNEPDNDADDQCGSDIGENNVISSTQIYAKIVAAYPNAKLIGPNTSYSSFGYGSPTGFLEAWRTRVITMGLPLPHGYGIHLYLLDPVSEWTQAYCDKLYEWGELDKELWVTEFGWSNDWVLGTNEATRQADMNTRVANQFGFFETGLTAGTPTPGAEPNCQITRYAWYISRRFGLTPTPGPTPEAPPWGYTDLYWYWSLTRSYAGNAYVDFGNLETPTPTPTP
jgi:hypothetical protein